MKFTDDIINNAASSFLKKVRRQHGITEGELATLLKVSQQQVSRYENGKTQLTLGRINQYLELFGLNWEHFSNELIRSTKEYENI